MIEEELLERLRTNPLDHDTRAVYADWLEQQGLAHRAAFLRAPDLAARHDLAVADPSAASWRRIVSLQPVTRCARLFRQGCAMAWEQLAPTAIDGERSCATCQRTVYYCVSLDDAERHGRDKDCVVVDLALDENLAKDRYDSVG